MIVTIPIFYQIQYFKFCRLSTKIKYLKLDPLCKENLTMFRIHIYAKSKTYTPKKKLFRSKYPPLIVDVDDMLSTYEY